MDDIKNFRKAAAYLRDKMDAIRDDQYPYGDSAEYHILQNIRNLLEGGEVQYE